MTPLSRFAQLPAVERRATILALAAIPAMHLALRLFGLRRIEQWTERPATVDAPERHTSPAEIVRAIARASNYGVHRGTCLSRSLALKWLLGRHGWTSDLRVGTRRTVGGIDAHAWLERDGVILNDTPDAVGTFGLLDLRSK
jgi:hypothetical protein